MKQSTVISTEPKSETIDKPRQPYTPPKATFVPLKLEERLLACGKHPGDGGNCKGNAGGPHNS